jgi:regulatory protein
MSIDKEKEVLELQWVEKIRRYCAFQERTEWEVRQKMKQYSFSVGQQDKLVELLKSEKFINDESFTEHYIMGKMNQKQWGKQMLKTKLLQKRIAMDMIMKYIDCISDEHYLSNLRYCIEKWTRSKLVDTDCYPKLYRYLLSKGYEHELIIEELKNHPFVG